LDIFADVFADIFADIAADIRTGLKLRMFHKKSGNSDRISA